MRKRVAVYSSSRRQLPPAPAPVVEQAEPPKPVQAAIARKPLNMRALAGALLVLLLGFVAAFLKPSPQQLPVPPEAAPVRLSAAEAYERIAPSVVRVRASPWDGTEELQSDAAENIGTGVVMIDSGVILTNLHVVQGAKRVSVVFADGLEAEAEVIGARPEHDLAVLQAKDIPDDLEPATMRSTSGLRPGDEVVAVGFPFGIGPSASGGIVSGLGRVFRSPEGKQEMKNLIQFDAAANPGNSGGPLVTMDGEVVGIVTAILNPTSARTFLGIGFAVPIENAAAAAGLPPF
jgi:S1-C subfamily serine protease